MSAKNFIKSNLFKCQTKTKKLKQRFLFDLDEIDKQYNSHSFEKEEKKNDNNDNNNKKDINKNNDNNEDKNKDNNNIINTANKVFKIRNIDDLEVIPLKNLHYIYSAWKSSNLILENFEKNILDKKNFEINYETFEIRTKNEKACNELKNEKFWILYIEYLKRNNKIKDTNDFIKIINLAFSYIEFDSKLLLVYYLDKIKKSNPIINNGQKVDNDEPYIDLLDTRIKNRINHMKENLSSNLKLKFNSYQKENNRTNNFYEYTPFKKRFKK